MVHAIAYRANSVVLLILSVSVCHVCVSFGAIPPRTCTYIKSVLAKYITANGTYGRLPFPS